MRHRLSIRTLMAFILASAVGLAALRNAGGQWAGLLILMAAAALETAILSAMFLRGPQRVWWVALALCTEGYLFLALDPWVSTELGSTHLLAYIHAAMTDNTALPYFDFYRSLIPHVASYDDFERAGHALFALLTGLVGGGVALWLHARRKRAEVAAGETRA